MRLRTYIWITGILGLFLFLLITALFLSVGGPAAAGFVVFFGVILLVGFLLNIWWVQRAVDNYGGSPFPGLLGLLGVEILSDDDPEELWHEAAWNAHPLTPGATSGPPGTWPRPSQSPEGASLGSGPSVATAATVSSRRCAKCGAFTDGAGSSFCRVCGTPFAA